MKASPTTGINNLCNYDLGRKYLYKFHTTLESYGIKELVILAYVYVSMYVCI